MKYYLDCEFDGHNGALLSMALARALLATAYVRGPKGHFQRAELPELKGSNA